MGVSLNWLAVENGDRAQVLERLGYVEAGSTSDAFAAPLVCAELPGGWFILLSEGMEIDLDKALPRAADDDRLVLGCEAEEHVMFSRLRAYRGGALSWDVKHDPDVDVTEVETEGALPAPFAALHAEIAATQADDDDGDVDYMFDLPSQLGHRLCGYTHQEPLPIAWTIVERAGRKQPTPPRLPGAFADEWRPMLEATGWRLAASDPDFLGDAWDMVRVVPGRHQVLRFRWDERGPVARVETRFVVVDEADLRNIFCAAGFPPVRIGGDPTAGGSLLKRLAKLFGKAPPETAEPAADPLEELVSQVKEDLAAVEAFLAKDERSSRLQINKDWAS